MGLPACKRKRSNLGRGARLVRRARVMALCLGLSGAGALVLQSGAAAAATPEETAAARNLAKQGLAAFNEQRFQEAADLFARAESLVHSPVHLLYEARARTKIGHFVKAQEAYIKIIRERFVDDAPQSFHNAKESAKNEVKELEGKLANLTVKIVGVDKGATLTLDGNEVSAVLVGVPMPVDPGEHTLEATAEGFKPASAKVTVAEGQRETLELKLLPEESAAPVAAAPADTPAATPTTSSPDAPADPGPTDSGGSSGMRIGSYVAFGVGAVGLGLGTVFFLDGKSKSDEADAYFDEHVDSNGNLNPQEAAEQNQLDDNADSATNLGVMGFVVGGVGVAAGVTLFLLSSSSDDSADAPRVTPWVGFNSAGISGTF